MTLRLVYRAMLTELSKVNSPSILLGDFNYWVNKAVNNYVNKQYNIYDVNQQTTDNLRVLASTATLDVKQNTKLPWLTGYYEFELPQDYLHLLNCICVYKVNGGYKCYEDGEYLQYSAKRLTADSWTIIQEDYYNRPTYYRPYYYIHNENKDYTNYEDDDTNYEDDDTTAPLNSMISTNPYNEEYGKDTGELYDGTDMNDKKYKVNVDSDNVVHSKNSNFRRTIKLANGNKIDAVDRETAYRYGNASKVRCELRIGNENDAFKPFKVIVDYLKTPQHLKLTLELLDLTQDTSLILEFPDYVCTEIINELRTLVMENTSDPRLQTSAAVSQTIASPAQQLSPLAQA